MILIPTYATVCQSAASVCECDQFATSSRPEVQVSASEMPQSDLLVGRNELCWSRAVRFHQSVEVASHALYLRSSFVAMFLCRCQPRTYHGSPLASDQIAFFEISVLETKASQERACAWLHSKGRHVCRATR